MSERTIDERVSVGSATEGPVYGTTLAPELRPAFERLISIAGQLARGECIPDVEQVIRCKTTPERDRGRTAAALNKIEDRLKDYAYELRQIADSLPKAQPVRMPI